MKYSYILLCSLIIIFLICGCGDDLGNRTRIATVEFTKSNKELGDKILVKFINSTSRWSHFSMSKSVQQQMKAFINDGQYEIVKVNTTHCSYCCSNLLNAEIYYRLKLNSGKKD